MILTIELYIYFAVTIATLMLQLSRRRKKSVSKQNEHLLCLLSGIMAIAMLITVSIYILSGNAGILRKVLYMQILPLIISGLCVILNQMVHHNHE